MPRLSRAQEAARRRIVALAGGGLSPEVFGGQLLAALQPAVPHDGARLFTVDPVTLLLNRLIAASEGDDPFRHLWLRQIYLTLPDVPYLAPQAVMRVGVTALVYLPNQDRMPVLPAVFRARIPPEVHTRAFFEARSPPGGSLRLCLQSDGRWLGMLDVVRRDPRQPIGPSSLAFLRIVAPVIARGLAAALARERALDAATPLPAPRRFDRTGPTEQVDASGIVLLTPDRRIGYASPAGEAWLRRLRDAERAGHGPLPTAVWTAVAGLRADASFGVGSAVIAVSDAGPVRIEASHGGPDGTVAVVLAPVRPPLAPSVPDHWPLTGRERRVVELLVAGLSNRRLAEALFVSDNTVETHLRHVYAKLDVRNRQELLARLFRDAYLPAFEAAEVAPASRASATGRVLAG